MNVARVSHEDVGGAIDMTIDGRSVRYGQVTEA